MPQKKKRKKSSLAAGLGKWKKNEAHNTKREKVRNVKGPAKLKRGRRKDGGPGRWGANKQKRGRQRSQLDSALKKRY